jgi:pimeloyl-ACP methyl ester carboxylesterase
MLNLVSLVVASLALGLLAPGAARAADAPIAVDLTFANGDVRLAATLLRPPSGGPVPAVVMLAGSGPATRDEIRPLAERLAGRGYGVLIFDKRGCGQSTGSWVTSSLDDLAEDAAAAVRALVTRTEIDRTRIGLWAHSQAGWYAPLAANREPSVAFLIVVSGGGASPRDVEWFGYERTLAAAAVTGGDLQAARDLLRLYFDYLATGTNRRELDAAIERAKGTPWYAALQIDRVLPSERVRGSWAWVASFDPVPSIERLSVPILLVFGGKDESTPTERAVERWTTAIRRSGRATATVRVFPEADHHITVGGHGGHGAAGATFAVGYVETMAAWLDAVTKR